MTNLPVEKIQQNREKVAKEYAKKWGVVVVLKGAKTVIASPAGEMKVTPFTNPVLATAGTGDVLAGVIAGMIAQGLVKPLGELMVDDIVRFQTVGETMQLSGGALGTKYLTMVLQNKVINGAKKSVVIRFTDRWAGRGMSKEEELERSVALFEEGGDNKMIYEVNPPLWVRRQFLVEVEADALLPKNDTFERTLKLEVYDRALNNPLIAQDPEKLGEVTRDFLFEPTVKGESAKYLPKDTERVLAGIGLQPQSGLAEKVVQRNALAGAGQLLT